MSRRTGWPRPRRRRTQFVDDLTPGVNLGIVSFAGIATVLVSPDHRPDGRQAGHRRAQAGRTHRHRRGHHLQPADHRAVLQDAAAVDGTDAGPPPARIVLMTDGKRTVGRTEQDAAQRAADAKVPVSVIAFGTDNGSITVNDETIPVPLDTEAMQQIAQISGGDFHTGGHRRRAQVGLRASSASRSATRPSSRTCPGRG